MKHADHTTTVQELKDNVKQFRTERGWEASATPRNLASSIIIEAAELLEHFQWGEYSPEERQEVVDELADIVNYCFTFANALDIDLATACRDKLDRTRQKFPTDQFYPGHQDEALYKKIKRTYRAKGKQ